MDANNTEIDSAFNSRVKKLINLSITNHKNTFSQFVWPEHIPDDAWWFSPDAMSVAGTEFAQTLSEQTLQLLSKWECVNQFSLNTLGEMELIHNVAGILPEMASGDAKEYLFHFIDEENKHMWYFNKFCMKYGNKVYANKIIVIENRKWEKELNHFLTFSRILIFEEIGHYFNIKNSQDERVFPFVREINRSHFQDESRHITFGRQLVWRLAETVLTSESIRQQVSDEINKAVFINLTAAYNPTVYRDAGIKKGMQTRELLLTSRHRKSVHQSEILKGIREVFNKIEIDIRSDI